VFFLTPRVPSFLLLFTPCLHVVSRLEPWESIVPVSCRLSTESFPHPFSSPLVVAVYFSSFPAFPSFTKYPFFVGFPIFFPRFSVLQPVRTSFRNYSSSHFFLFPLFGACNFRFSFSFPSGCFTLPKLPGLSIWPSGNSWSSCVVLRLNNCNDFLTHAGRWDRLQILTTKFVLLTSRLLQTPVQLQGGPHFGGFPCFWCSLPGT